MKKIRQTPASIRFRPEKEFELRRAAKLAGLPFSTYLRTLIEKAYESPDAA